MRYAPGLRIRSVLANLAAAAFVIAVWDRTKSEFALIESIPATVAFGLSVVHSPRVRMNGLGKFDFGAGG